MKKKLMILLILLAHGDYAFFMEKQGKERKQCYTLERPFLKDFQDLSVLEAVVKLKTEQLSEKDFLLLDMKSNEKVVEMASSEAKAIYLDLSDVCRSLPVVNELFIIENSSWKLGSPEKFCNICLQLFDYCLIAYDRYLALADWLMANGYEVIFSTEESRSKKRGMLTWRHDFLCLNDLAFLDLKNIFFIRMKKTAQALKIEKDKFDQLENKLNDTIKAMSTNFNNYTKKLQ
jgi:hypothetical protein